MTEKKPRFMGDKYDKPEEKVRLRFVGGEGAPTELHGQSLRLGEVRLLSRRYLLYRWWKAVDETEPSV